MDFRSKPKGDRISQVYFYYEDSAKELEAAKKYNYCSEEVAVVDTIVKDCYESYIGFGIYESDFYKNNGLVYSINISLINIGEGLKYNVKYYISRIRINGKDVTYKKTYSYTCKYGSNFRNTLNRLIKDLFLDGTIAKFYK